MAGALSEKIVQGSTIAGTIGKELLDVLTSGMYSDPRMALREYIQNAADSIDEAVARKIVGHADARIELRIDGRERTITVSDNGTGVMRCDIERRLGSLGCSEKTAGLQRGFRGIGRLGGLAYCDILRFETRCSVKELVSIVEWNGERLRQRVADSTGHERLEDALRRIATRRDRRPEAADPERFFRVTMLNVHRFHSDVLMNIKGLADYLSHSAPVDYPVRDFPFAERITSHLEPVTGFRAYQLTLNGLHVSRPYRLAIEVRKGQTDHVRDIQTVECISSNGELLCRGWYGITDFLSSLPQHVGMRGIRIRQGNIAVGDEYYLKDFFSESRFATWHIGEIHVSQTLRLNARRDGFEESPDYEEFLEWVSGLCKGLSSLCRESSKTRSTMQSAERLVGEVEELLALPFFVDDDHFLSLQTRLQASVQRLRSLPGSERADWSGKLGSFEERAQEMTKSPVFLKDVLDGRSLRRKENRELVVEVCREIVRQANGRDPMGLILHAVAPYLKTSHREATQAS